MKKAEKKKLREQVKMNRTNSLAKFFFENELNTCSNFDYVPLLLFAIKYFTFIANFCHENEFGRWKIVAASEILEN